MTIRSYTELLQFHTFKERYEYLRLRGSVSEETFGFERYLNQNFYRSAEWRNLRPHIVNRDLGNDLGIEDYPIFGKVIIHHMNPISAEDIIHGNMDILDPDFLICVSLRTHNAIHYGDASLLAEPLVERRPGDTKLW